MITRPIIRSIIRPITRSIIGVIQRYFSTLDPVQNSHYTLATPIVFSGDFAIDYATTTTSTAMNFADDFGISSAGVFVAPTSITGIELNGASVGLGATAPLDGKLNNVKFIGAVSETITVFSRNGSSANYFKGELANPSLPNTTFTLGNGPLDGDVEYSAENTFGSEEVVNGDFATDSDWAKNQGTTIQGGNLALNSTAAFATLASQALSLDASKAWQLEVEVTDYVSGTVNVRQGSSGSNNIIAITANGVYAIPFSGAAQTSLEVRSSSGDTIANVSNISIREIQSNAVTYEFIPAANREEFTLTDGDWVGEELGSTSTLNLSGFGAQGIITDLVIGEVYTVEIAADSGATGNVGFIYNGAYDSSKDLVAGQSKEFVFTATSTTFNAQGRGDFVGDLFTSIKRYLEVAP